MVVLLGSPVENKDYYYHEHVKNLKVALRTCRVTTRDSSEIKTKIIVHMKLESFKNKSENQLSTSREHFHAETCVFPERNHNTHNSARGCHFRVGDQQAPASGTEVRETSDLVMFSLFLKLLKSSDVMPKVSRDLTLRHANV